MGEEIEESLILDKSALGHLRITKSLESCFKNLGHEVKTNKEYTTVVNNTALDGEFDLVSINEERKVVIVFEIKSRKSPGTSRKAYSQLAKDWVYLSSKHKDYHFVLMYAWGDENSKKGYSVRRCNQDSVLSKLDKYFD